MDAVQMMQELIFMVAFPAIFAMCLNQISHNRAKECLPKVLAPYSKLALIFVVISNSSKVAPYIRHMNGQRVAVAVTILVLGGKRLCNRTSGRKIMEEGSRNIYFHDVRKRNA